jgi:hypothetical protein
VPGVGCKDETVLTGRWKIQLSGRMGSLAAYRQFKEGVGDPFLEKWEVVNGTLQR